MKNSRRFPGAFLAPAATALLLLAGGLFFTACPAQLAWEEGQRNACRQHKSLARRCWSYGLISNLQCQKEEADELKRAAQGDFTPSEKSNLRITDLTCDKDILVTYAYCNSLIPESCRLEDWKSPTAGSSSSSSSSSARARDSSGSSSSSSSNSSN